MIKRKTRVGGRPARPYADSVLRRRSPEPPAPAVVEPEPAPKPGGKGRPTPKRSEAQKRRPAVTAPPPATRKEAYRRAKERSKERRTEIKAAVARGEDKYLPARDAGPVRALVRDLVDARRNLASYLLPITFLFFLGQLPSSPAFRNAMFSAWTFATILMVLDTALLGRRIVTTVRTRFPESTERGRSLVFYGVSRATSPRRIRLPSPRVRPGDEI